MRSFFTTLFCAAVAATALPVLAAETRVVPANQATEIIFHYTVSPDCHSGAKPTFYVTSGPSHGAVTSVWKGFRMGSEGGNCAGKPAHGTVVTYRPNPGYHGPDKVSFLFSEGMGNDYIVAPKEYTVNITVK